MLSEKCIREICISKISIIMKAAKNRRMWIFGAGIGGKIISDVFSEQDIAIAGFVDRNAKTIKWMNGKPVVKLEQLNSDKDYIIISLRGYESNVIEFCKKNGFLEDDVYYLVAGEFDNCEDIIWHGCKVGRYTYGYKELLEFYPIAESIGRYCSINGTAKIWNNHSTDCVTTHPFLDYPLFYPWEKQTQRIEMISKYGKHFDNAEYENSFLRKNKPVFIGNDVWIGANAILLPGVHIGNGAIIAAGAVVAHDVEPYAIVGGVPAKLIKYRYNKDIIQKFEKIQWWNWEHSKIEENIELFYQVDKFLENFG